MKGIVGFAALAVLLVGIPATAADLYPSQASGPSGSHAQALTPVSITQNLDTTILEAASIHCGTPDGVHTDNSHLRRFFLWADHSLFMFDLLSVDFGIEEASSLVGAPSQPVDINLYSIASSDPFIFANLTLISSTTVQIPNDGSATFQFFNAAATGTIQGATYDLVVEMFTPQNVSAGNVLWPGANTRGQTRPTFIAAADCALPEPTDVASIGFPSYHLFFVVNGDEGGATPFESTSWSRLRAHYR